MSNVLKMAAVGGAVSAETDEDFNQTVLLLHGDGTNGAQNNTFLDSSTNNFTITRNGNTTQGTFSPFSVGAGEWSNYFDGSGDYLTLSGNPVVSTNFTIEFWFYMPSWGNRVFLSQGGGTANFNTTNGLAYQIYATSTDFYVQWADGSGGNDFISTATSGIALNAWHHVAIGNNGTTTRVWIDGVSIGSDTGTPTWGSPTTKSTYIGYISYSSSYVSIGYMSNVRIVTSDVYGVSNTTITMPTAPLTAISNTSLLTCQSNRFVDNSTNAFAITRNGDVRVTPFSPFAPSAAYSASTNGGSGYFDGTGDYLSLPTSQQILPATGDFTIEGWFYPTSLSTDAILYAQTNGGASAGRVNFYVTSAGAIVFQVGSTTYTGTSGVVRVNQWNYIAATRTGSSVAFYANGATAGSGTVSGTIDTGSSVTGINISASATASAVPGYISAFRISDTIRSSLTSIPSAPYSSDGNTKLLCNFTNAGIFDQTGKNVLETVGNAQIDTTTKKFGTGALEFDGTTDYVVQPTNENYGYGTGDFTIEFWLNLNSVTGSQTVVSNLTSASSTNPHLYMSASSIRYYTANADRITGGALSTGQWYHIALVRASGSTRLYIDGTQSGSTYSDTNNYGATAPLGIGTYWASGSPVTTSTLNGFIDDLRITKGVARYPTEPFPTKAFPDL
jgi:hypothetical protein